MNSYKPLQIKVAPSTLTKAQLFAEHEGFRSVASMAYYAFVQFLNNLEEKKLKSYNLNEVEKEIITKSEDDIKQGRVYTLSEDNLNKLFE